nr:MAG TPA: hypothetical protein [Caudoviricetes sp.]
MPCTVQCRAFFIGSYGGDRLYIFLFQIRRLTK